MANKNAAALDGAAPPQRPVGTADGTVQSAKSAGAGPSARTGSGSAPKPGPSVDQLRSETDALVRTYHDAQTRLLLLDYDGTLTPIVKDPEAALPSEELLQALHVLTEDRRNVVFIISGRDERFLSKHLGHLRGIGFSAEHGCFVKQPGSEQWANLTKDMDMAWMVKVLDVFQHYTEHTPGSSIEHKKSSITWHYRNAKDSDFGSAQADECKAQLEKLIQQQNLAVDVLVGKKNLEVRPFAINKGEIVKRILQQHAEDVDFVFCAGDDKTDEDMFRALDSLEPLSAQGGDIMAPSTGSSAELDSLPLTMSPPAPLGVGWTAETGSPNSNTDQNATGPSSSNAHTVGAAPAATSAAAATRTQTPLSEASSSSISLQTSSSSAQESLARSTSGDDAATTAASSATSAEDVASRRHSSTTDQLGLAVSERELQDVGGRPRVLLPKLRKKSVFTTVVGPPGSSSFAKWRVDGPELVIGCLVEMASRG